MHNLSLIVPFKANGFDINGTIISLKGIKVINEQQTENKEKNRFYYTAQNHN